LDLLPGYEGAVDEVVRKAECFDVFLQAWGDAALVAPETVAFEILLLGCEEALDLGEFLGAPVVEDVRVVVVVISVCCETVEEEYKLFG
jgi:hypothetical protein